MQVVTLWRTKFLYTLCAVHKILTKQANMAASLVYFLVCTVRIFFFVVLILK